LGFWLVFDGVCIHQCVAFGSYIFGIENQTMHFATLFIRRLFSIGRRFWDANFTWLCTRYGIHLICALHWV